MKPLNECSREELQQRFEQNFQQLRALRPQITELEDKAIRISIENDEIRTRLNQIAAEQRAVLQVVA